VLAGVNKPSLHRDDERVSGDLDNDGQKKPRASGVSFSQGFVSPGSVASSRCK